MKVGARELKNRLGHYLRQVKAGETVHVTDRGKIVAELKPSPPAKTGEGEALRKLAAEGAITLGTGEHEDIAPYRVTRGKKLASRMIIDDRR
jgi:antitoxin (DNA-binding transcriptional repressor) of toxin-antitoxin stability system